MQEMLPATKKRLISYAVLKLKHFDTKKHFG